MRQQTPISCFLALLLAGCAAAMPGHVPDKSRLKIADMAAKSKQEAPGTRAVDGSYVPSADERAYTCRRLTGVMQLKIQQVRDSEANPPTGLMASVMSKSTTPRHTTSGAPSAAYSDDRARLIALNNLMIEKNCGRFDLDAALRPGNTELPDVIGAPKGKPRL